MQWGGRRGRSPEIPESPEKEREARPAAGASLGEGELDGPACRVHGAAVATLLAPPARKLAWVRGWTFSGSWVPLF